MRRLDAHTLADARKRAERAALAGGAVIRSFESRRSELQVEEKGTNELVTQVDVAAQRAIVASLKGAVAGAEFLGEEEELGQGEQPDLCWIIDPLDGTTNFTHGIPPWAVSVALVEHGRPVAGAVLDVTTGELFSAARGQGLTANGEPAHASRTATLADSLISTGFPYRDQRYTDDYLAVLKTLMAGTRGRPSPRSRRRRLGVDCVRTFRRLLRDQPQSLGCGRGRASRRGGRRHRD